MGAELAREEVRGRLELTINNFLGGLRKLRIRIHPAYVVIPSVFDVQQRGPAAENDVQLTQPDIFGSNASLHALAGYDLGIADGYQYYGPRGQIGVDRPFFRGRMLAGGSWNFQYLDFFNVNTDVFNSVGGPFFGFENPYRLAYLEEFVQVDLRDRPLDPRFGAFFLVHVEQGADALGSAFQYVKVAPDLRLYAPLGRRVVFAVRGLVGWLRPAAGQSSPITRRFSLGGPSSHRGFGFGRLAPQVRDSQGHLIPIGGDGEVLGSAEARIDVKKVGGAWLDVVPFVDAGNVTPTFSNLGAFEPERRRRPVARVHDPDRRRARRRRCARQPTRGRRRARSRAALRLPHHDRRSVLRTTRNDHDHHRPRTERTCRCDQPRRRQSARRCARVLGWVLRAVAGGRRPGGRRAR